MKILAFAASNSTTSINRMLVSHAAQEFANMVGETAQITYLDLNDYELAIYSPEREAAEGIPKLAQDFYAAIGDADRILISFAEYNGNYSPAYLNTFDWASRISQKVFQDRPLVIMATSPGGRGGRSVLDISQNLIPHFGGDIRGELSVPRFHETFDKDSGRLSDPELSNALTSALIALK